MDNDLDTLYQKWHNATGNLKWGVHKVFKDVLQAAKDEKITLIYGSDYGDGGACLVNTAGVFLTTHAGLDAGGGQGIPTANFSEVVSVFDTINAQFHNVGVNVTPGTVSPLGADILLRHYGNEPGKDFERIDAPVANEAFASVTYREPTDQEIARDLANAFVNAKTRTDIVIYEENVQNVSIDSDSEVDSNVNAEPTC